jgi:hypothetical protein
MFKVSKPIIFSFLAFAFLLLPLAAFSWGFYCHKLINQKAVYALPPGMIQFYKEHEAYLSKHAVDPDLRKHSVEKEGAQHYIDIDHYGLHPFDSVPRYWKNAVTKFTEDTLRKYGVLPWTINDYYYRLVKAFKDLDTAKILKISADLGHYAADACVPLHVTENYDGQFTNQQGIHRLWETLIPERYSKTYKLDYSIAHYIHHPLDSTWTVLQHSFSLKDKVLDEDKKLREKFEQDKMYEIYTGKKKKDFSAAYITQYNASLDGMVEKQLKSSIEFVSSLWYSAWVEAGQPNLMSRRN